MERPSKALEIKKNPEGGCKWHEGVESDILVSIDTNGLTDSTYKKRRSGMGGPSVSHQPSGVQEGSDNVI